MKIKALAAGLAFALIGTSAFSATVQTDSLGAITGINGVTLSTGDYDVAFKASPDYTDIISYSDSFAFEASQGLLGLFNSGTLGAYDINSADPFGIQVFHTFGQAVYDPQAGFAVQPVFLTFNDLTAGDTDFSFQDFALADAFQLSTQISGSPFDFSTVWTESAIEPNVSAVPLPAAAFLFAPAMLGFMGLRRKAKNATQS